MKNIYDLSVEVTNLTICLPVTIAKAWHFTRTHEFEVFQRQLTVQREKEHNKRTSANVESDSESIGKENVIDTRSVEIEIPYDKDHSVITRRLFV